MASKAMPALGLEREYGEKIDRCIGDTLLKAGAGFLVGGIFSFALFKRRAWPLTLGTGVGLGIAYRNCEDNLRSHYIKKTDDSEVSLVKNAPKIDLILTDKATDECSECSLEEAKKLSDTLISNSENILKPEENSEKTEE